MQTGLCGRRFQLDRRHFIGGSDVRIIMGQDEKALIRLWQEKRGEVGPAPTCGPWPAAPLLATGLFRHPLAESDAGAVTILIDKHDAGFFKCPLQRFNGALFQFFPSLKSSDRINRHLGRGS